MFFAKEERLSLLVALVMGFQHFLAMCVGLITPPILVGALAGSDLDTRSCTLCVLGGLCVRGVGCGWWEDHPFVVHFHVSNTK